VTECDYRRCFDSNGIYYTLHHLFATLHKSHRQVFSAFYSLEQPLHGNGFQRPKFPFLWLPGLYPASVTIFSQQQVTTTKLRFQYFKKLRIFTKSSRKYEASANECVRTFQGDQPCQCRVNTSSALIGVISQEYLKEFFPYLLTF
jgi:hypothetical protein